MIVWAYAFIDRPIDRFDGAAAFWTAVTGTTLSPRRGEHDEFATFEPSSGHAYLKLQGVDPGGEGGAHLDLVTRDVDTLRHAAEQLGATTVAAHTDWHVLRSPGDQLFCAVPFEGEGDIPAVHTPAVPDTVDADDADRSGRPTPSGRLDSRVDQVCINVSPERFDAEVAFWTQLTGWSARPSDLAEFHVIRSPATIPLRILIQRVEAPQPTTAHVDLACSDVPAARAWHESHGATFLADGKGWMVMRDPAGGVYCLTARSPKTGE